MADLSVVILTFNEAENIAECIRSVGDLAGEIVVLDSGSTDGTREIAAGLGARVEEAGPWRGWGVKRQEAQQLCRCTFVMHLDADERITDELRSEIKLQLSRAGGRTVLSLPRLTDLFGVTVRHSGWYPDYVDRIYPKAYTAYSSDLVHEKLVVPPDAELIRLKSPLRHYSYRHIGQFYMKQARYALAYGQNHRQRRGRVSLSLVPLRGLIAFVRSYFLRRGFLDGRTGLWLAMSQATYTMNKYLALAAWQDHGAQEENHGTE